MIPNEQIIVIKIFHENDRNVSLEIFFFIKIKIKFKKTKRFGRVTIHLNNNSELTNFNILKNS